MKIPKEFKLEHVLLAIADLNNGMPVLWGKSRKYDLVYDGKHTNPYAER